jgi:hypothetical protein
MSSPSSFLLLLSLVSYKQKIRTWRKLTIMKRKKNKAFSHVCLLSTKIQCLLKKQITAFTNKIMTSVIINDLWIVTTWNCGKWKSVIKLMTENDRSSKVVFLLRKIKIIMVLEIILRMSVGDSSKNRTLLS